MTAYSSAVLAKSPLAYYRCADTVSPLVDASGNNRNATVQNSISLDNSSLIGADRATDHSIFCGGNGGSGGDYAIFSATGLPSGSSDFTALVWLAPSFTQNYDPAVALFWGQWGVSAYQAVTLGVSSALHAKFSAFSLDVVDSNALNAGQLYMLAVTYKASTGRVDLWRNVGTTITSVGNAMQTLNIVLSAAALGGVPNNTNSYHGYLDEAAIFGSCLLQSDLQTIYNDAAVKLQMTATASGTLSATAHLIVGTHGGIATLSDSAVALATISDSLLST